MVTLLRHLFIKDYQNTNDPKVRNAHGRFAAIFGIITNLLVVAMKVATAIILFLNHGGIWPIALIADATDNVADLSSSIITLVGFRLSSKPADKEHPFGHERIEYIAGLIVAVFIIVAGLELLKSSIESIANYYSQGIYPIYELFAIIVLSVSVLLKALQAYVNRGFGVAINSAALKAVAIDSLVDVLKGLAVLISGLLMMLLSWNFIDGFAGAVVSLLVLYSGIEAVKDTASPLIGEANNKELVQTIKDTVKENPNVLGIHDVLCHSYGSEKKYVSLHIEIAESMSLHDAHEIADELEEILEEKLHANVVIHVDPVNDNDPVVSSLKEKAEKALKELDSSVSIHDLHLHKEKKRIDCDIMAPYESKLGEEELISAIKKALPEYDVRIHLDHPMDN